MNLWKLAALFTLAAITGLCVGYAHSAGRQTLEYKSSAWLGTCSLKAEKTGGAAWNFVAVGHSRTRFASAWPTVPGEMFLSWGPKPSRELPLVGADEPLPDETLTIKFDLVNGMTTPVSYTFDNVKLRIATKGMIQAQTCPLK